MIITIDEDLCVGCGRCMEICPAAFFLNEELGLAEVIDPDACDYAGCCEAAEENCPEKAIRLDN